jgi:monoamine oxidase
MFFEDGRPAALDAYEAAEARWEDAVGSRLGEADCSLAAAAAAVAEDPWTASIETWEGAIIAAADADVLSLHDWNANALEGANYVAPGGLGAMLARCLGPDAGEIRFSARVTRIEAEAGGVRVLTQSGQGVRAGAAMVTVSTGVLRDGGIGFFPALPAELLGALEGLPMGLLTKVALPAAGDERFGLPPGSGLFRRVVSRGAPGASVILWPDGGDFALGFFGGRVAWGFCHRPDEAAAFIGDELAAMLGKRARAVFAGSGLMTGWGSDPAFLGAYAYALPGHAGARAALQRPAWDGRLVFAGEACATNGLAGTVAGAYQSGRHAAQGLLSGFTRQD